MDGHAQSWTLDELAERFAGELDGPGSLRLHRLGSIDTNDPEALAFAETPAYLARAEACSIGAVLVPPGYATSKPCVRVANPRAVFATLLAEVDRPLNASVGVHPTAVVDSTAEVHPDACLGPYCVVERGARVAAGARVYAFAYIGERCVVGEGAAVYPHAVLVRDVELEARAVVHPGAVVGGDGFRYDWDGTQRVKIPHVGGVLVGEGAEIGSNATVDRGTAGNTVLGAGTKLDNLVQVAHNAQIGSHVVVASQTGISGSTHVGDRVMLGGQCGIADHVTVVADTVCAGGTGITGDIREPGVYIGMPARPIREGRRILAALGRLPDLMSRVRRLEQGDDEGTAL